MLWFAFALTGALCQAVYGLLVKVLLRTIKPYPLAGFSFLSGSLVLLLVSFLSGIPPLGPGLLPAVAVTVAINLIATVLFYRALATTDLSLCIPMLAFTPVFLILTSFLILGELPSPAGVLGILLVTAGAYLLNLEYRDGRPCSLKAPFESLVTHRGLQTMLLVAFLYSISVNYDKQVVTESDPIFGSAIVLFLLGIAFLLLAIGTGSGLHGSGSDPEESFRPSSRQVLVFPVFGIFLAFEAITINLAYTMAIVPYVISVKRLSVFFSVLFGGLLLGEPQLAGRMMGAGVMFAGAVVIGIWG
ncbi:MAG: EamA family transporter [Methanoregulaceae archaeon]|nr:EamA family transporter [Methanoregulaceae archaeon]